MAFTQTDLDNIDIALLELATGTKVVRVTINDKTVQYQETDIDKLQKVRAMIQAEVGTAATRVYAKNKRV